MSRSVLTLSGSQVLGLSARCSRTMRAEAVSKRETFGEDKTHSKVNSLDIHCTRKNYYFCVLAGVTFEI